MQNICIAILCENEYFWLYIICYVVAARILRTKYGEGYLFTVPVFLLTGGGVKNCKMLIVMESLFRHASLPLFTELIINQILPAGGVGVWGRVKFFLNYTHIDQVGGSKFCTSISPKLPTQFP